jgi:hypothetical protein
MRGALRETLVAAIDKKQVQSIGRRAPNRTNLGDKQLRRQPITAPTRGRITGRIEDLRQATIKEFGPEVRITGRDKEEKSLEEKERLKKLKLSPAQALNPVAVATLGDQLKLELDDAKTDQERGDIIMDLVLPAIDTLQENNQTDLAINLIERLGRDVNRQAYPGMGLPDTITGLAEWNLYGSKALLFLAMLGMPDAQVGADGSTKNSPVRGISGAKQQWRSLLSGVTSGGRINLRDLTFATAAAVAAERSLWVAAGNNP